VRWFPLLVAWGTATGCGRLAFDSHSPFTSDGATSEIPAGHDEDGDGVADGSDGCPHIADSTQPDRDGDEVDDACDPNPDTPGDAIITFEPFTAMSGPFNVAGATPTFDGESMHVDARMAAFTATLTVTPTHDVLQIGGSVGQANPSGLRQITVEARGPQGRYYCELVDGAVVRLSLTYTLDEVSFPAVASAPVQGPVANGAFVLQMATAPPAADCAARWGGTDYTAGGSVPGGITPTSIALTTQYLELTIDYFIEIRSP